MWPRFVGRLGAADAVTVANAVLGFAAVVVAPASPMLAARLVLLAAVADGLDGVVARRVGGSPVGGYLDSLSDVASFGVAPALLVTTVAADAWGLDILTPSAPLAAAAGVSALFFAVVVVRLGFFTAFDADDDHTEGVPSTLAATVLASAILAGAAGATTLVVAAAAFAYLMSARITYPDLLARDALVMGVVHALAVFAPRAFGRAFPYALLTLAIAYLVLAPRFYWRPSPRR